MIIYEDLRNKIETKYNQTSQQKNFCLQRVSNIQDCNTGTAFYIHFSF